MDVDEAVVVASHIGGAIVEAVVVSLVVHIVTVVVGAGTSNIPVGIDLFVQVGGLRSIVFLVAVE